MLPQPLPLQSTLPICYRIVWCTSERTSTGMILHFQIRTPAQPICQTLLDTGTAAPWTHLLYSACIYPVLSSNRINFSLSPLVCLYLCIGQTNSIALPRKIVQIVVIVSDILSHISYRIRKDSLPDCNMSGCRIYLRVWYMLRAAWPLCLCCSTCAACTQRPIL